MARVLLTRPAEDAERTAARLRADGHEPLVAPLLAVETRVPDVAPREWQAALFTSRNATLHLPPGFLAPHVPSLAVGETTAKAVRQAGFADVRVAGGDADALVALATATLDPAGGPLVHPCGVHRTGDVPERLAERGFETVLAPCYEAVPLPLSDAARAALRSGTVDAALLYSPRSARVFAAAIGDGEGLPARVLALSRAVASALPPALQARAAWPASPSEAALLALLDGPDVD